MSRSTNASRPAGIERSMSPPTRESEACIDIEMNQLPSQHLVNDTVHHFAWKDLNVTVKDRTTKRPLSILDHASGMVYAGEMLAIMGPSGSGKTTLLNALAHRKAAAGAATHGEVMANGQSLSLNMVRKLSSYVEQEDILIGSLTVRETVSFAAGLALPDRVSRRERKERVDGLVASFGLQQQAQTIVGTVIRKGISGGQKKRLGVASRLVTDPKILFLDEPTSGLDSTISYEVMSYIKDVARRNNPSTATFSLFDRLCVLSKGKTCYYGALQGANRHFADIGYELPLNINPAEYYLDLVNTDLAREQDGATARQHYITSNWFRSIANQQLIGAIDGSYFSKRKTNTLALSAITVEKPSLWKVCVVLLHRLWIKAYRDVIAYQIRIAMYMGLAFLMGTVFLRFKAEQQYIQPFINAIFFGSAFMSFMAVAYVPAFIEDHANFARERANGLVGPFAFLASNFVIGLPFLLLIAVLFSLVTYFLIGFHADARAFFVFVLWLFLDLLAAESLVVLVSVACPIFVVALAVAAFANGLWMCVGGFLVPLSVLNPFWEYAFHYIDYQAYVFKGMMVNEFKDRTYACARRGDGFQCAFPNVSRGKIAGSAVLEAMKIPLHREGQWIAIMLAIIAVHRILAFIVLHFKKH